MNHMLKVRLMYVLLAKLGINYISISNSSKKPSKKTKQNTQREDNHESFGSEAMLART